MKLGALHLRQRDGVTCGPTVAVVAGALLDPGRRAELSDPAWFDGEQARVHREVNRLWPRRLGTTPTGMARALTARSCAAGVRYRWRLFHGRRDSLSDVQHAAEAPGRVGLSAAVRVRTPERVDAVGDELIGRCVGFLEAGDHTRPVAFGL